MERQEGRKGKAGRKMTEEGKGRVEFTPLQKFLRAPPNHQLPERRHTAALIAEISDFIIWFMPRHIVDVMTPAKTAKCYNGDHTRSHWLLQILSCSAVTLLFLSPTPTVQQRRHDCPPPVACLVIPTRILWCLTLSCLDWAQEAQTSAKTCNLSQRWSGIRIRINADWDLDVCQNVAECGLMTLSASFISRVS